MTATTTPAHRYIGITDECVECQKCGRTELRSTVVLAILDADGNTEDVTYYGSSCAARALGVKGGGRAVLQSARWAHEKTIEAAREAREKLEFYGLPLTGEPTLRELREPVWKFVEVHRNAMWIQNSTVEQNRAHVLDMLARCRAAIADAEALTATAP